MNKLLTDYFKARCEHDTQLDNLSKETNRVVGCILKSFRRSRPSTASWWAYGWYEGDQYGPVPEKPDFQNDVFGIYISEACETTSHNYSDGFPVIFFDMSDSEIMSYIKKEKEQDAFEQEIKRLKARKAKEVKKNQINYLKSTALAKLTAEERRVLKLN